MFMLISKNMFNIFNIIITGFLMTYPFGGIRGYIYPTPNTGNFSVLTAPNTGNFSVLAAPNTEKKNSCQHRTPEIFGVDQHRTPKPKNVKIKIRFYIDFNWHLSKKIIFYFRCYKISVL